jgi:hypothetical protein
MIILGLILAIIGFSLLWFNPPSGIILVAIGLGIVWSFEDQKIRRKREKELYDEELEIQFNELKYEEPVSPRLFEVCTQLYGTIKAHQAWLLQNLDEFEEAYIQNPELAITESQDVKGGKYKTLFKSGVSYQNICEFLNREYSEEIFEDIQKLMNKTTTRSENDSENGSMPSLSDLLADYDLEEWAKPRISASLHNNLDRDAIINQLTLDAKKELNKDISVACLRNEWIINGTVKFKI